MTAHIVIRVVDAQPRQILIEYCTNTGDTPSYDDFTINDVLRTKFACE